jgi:hypothetical protein
VPSAAGRNAELLLSQSRLRAPIERHGVTGQCLDPNRSGCTGARSGLIAATKSMQSDVTLEDLKQEPPINSRKDRIPGQTNCPSFEFLDLTPSVAWSFHHGQAPDLKREHNLHLFWAKKPCFDRVKLWYFCTPCFVNRFGLTAGTYVRGGLSGELLL